MELKKLEIPDLEYFKFKNIYTGSQGEFRYRIAPINGMLEAFTYEHFCFESAQTLAKQSFTLDGDGLAALNDWLCQQAACYEQMH